MSTNLSDLCMLVVKTLIKKNMTIALAESCTGGMIGSTFADIPGVSAVFLEDIVTYSNDAKIRLGVKSETLSKHGAVSEQTAGEMAESIRKRAGASVGVSTTGIAGPDGGTSEKPVGLVYVGISTENGTFVRKLNLSGNRQDIRKNTTLSVFNFILEEL